MLLKKGKIYKGLSIEIKKEVEAKLLYQKIADKYGIDKSTVLLIKNIKQRESIKYEISPTRTRRQAV